jgi:hypothetical protein
MHGKVTSDYISLTREHSVKLQNFTLAARVDQDGLVGPQAGTLAPESHLNEPYDGS